MKHTAQLLAAIAFLAGCSDKPITTEITADIQPPAAAAGKKSLPDEDNGLGPDANDALRSAVNRDLAALRRVTAPFHVFDVASRAGWSAQITPCMTDPAGAGGMGFHYGNTALIDGTARVTAPQLLLYEPEKNGTLRLVAVEYIIPYTFHARSAEPPVLFGQKFQQVDAFQLWGLHAWVWKDNPSGIFASWNPRVTCDNATAVMSMSH